MTLIIGLKCSDGIVVGSDGAATLGNIAGLRTVIQPVPKLAIIRDKMIVGVSGPVGLGQLFCDRVDEVCNDLRDDRGPEVCRKLRQAFLKDAEITLKVAALCTQIMGPSAQVGALHQTLVALATRGMPLLIQFDYQCAPEMATDDLPFVAIGSGQNIADPFLAFLRHVFWKDHLPNIPEGGFAVMWTLIHAIRTAPGGIAEPIHLAVLQMEGTQPSARLLSDKELREHRVMVEEVEGYLNSFPKSLQPGEHEAEPPSPPVAAT
jgi:ATP-dependent protease HslVU (ClpYQ) peptidase subunit